MRDPAAISQGTTLVRRPIDPLIAELNQWRDAMLAELHEAFDDAIIARDRLADVTQRRQPARAKPKPTLLDAEVALIRELANLVGVGQQLHDVTLDLEKDADVAAVGLMQTAREVERQHRRILPPPPPVGVWDEEGGP